MDKRNGKHFALAAAVLLTSPTIINSKMAKADECPRLIIVVACDSKAKRRCCPTFIAGAGGNLGLKTELLRFTWTVSSGNIIKGQGTPEMRFETKGANEKEIEIRLKVEGLDDWPQVCRKELFVKIDYCKEKEKFAST